LKKTSMPKRLKNQLIGTEPITTDRKIENGQTINRFVHFFILSQENLFLTS
jgi:hypothetical protein